ncbi:hypothetical protein FALBO_2981 [Fusarium albosuccineum]|uniref:Uncharacterized protein n=1 Tax=Fusarium albosuccineum TaxID=1237068 RepID=A0A8H4PHI1_9HYPO|nr:hypothetical protein FALBO_2981 [Fusarium albosuccineum]
MFPAQPQLLASLVVDSFTYTGLQIALNLDFMQHSSNGEWENRVAQGPRYGPYTDSFEAISGSMMLMLRKMAMLEAQLRREFPDLWNDVINATARATW